MKRILPICTDYVEISRYVDEHTQFKYGLVNHAICAAINSLLKDYLILVAQLENQYRQGKLTLQVAEISFAIFEIVHSH